jgi:signal transduction histidine kinase
MDKKGCRSFSAKNFQGEFGKALATKKLQYIKRIPEDTRFSFLTITGSFIPREIITIPIISANKTIAVISLCSIKSFSKNSLDLLNTIHSTLSARLDGVLSYRKVIAVSTQLELQNTELEAQKNELEAQKNELENQKNSLVAQADELNEQNIELEMQKNMLDQANRLKTIFLSNMSHELRTPLNSVIALSGVLNRRLEGKIAQEEYSYLGVIERNGKQLLSLINDILDLSRIEAGREEIELKSFAIKDLIHDVIEVIEPQAAEKNISLNYVTAGKLPPITSDYEKCRHILQNIVANAVKFTDNGGVEIAVEQNQE